MTETSLFPSFHVCFLSNVFIFLTNGEKNSQLFIRTRNNSFETFTLVGLFMAISHRIGSICSTYSEPARRAESIMSFTLLILSLYCDGLMLKARFWREMHFTNNEWTMWQEQLWIGINDNVMVCLSHWNELFYYL